MPDTPCLVAIGAHAADMEFSAGATILKHARAGWQTHIINLTLGEKGHARLSPEEYGTQKRAEAEAAAAALQATPHFLPFRDGELQGSETEALAVARLLRQTRPQVIITHWGESIHGDHAAAAVITRRAMFLAGIRHFDLDGLPPMGWARLYYADNWEDPDHFRPYSFVDISAEVEGWQAAFACFAIGRGEGGFPYWDWYEARTRLHGIALRTRHAMAFAVDEARMIAPRELL
jgi:LmbE family N-acetylglucosaminyl deacetylase